MVLGRENGSQSRGPGGDACLGAEGQQGSGEQRGGRDEVREVEALQATRETLLLLGIKWGITGGFEQNSGLI